MYATNTIKVKATKRMIHCENFPIVSIGLSVLSNTPEYYNNNVKTLTNGPILFDPSSFFRLQNLFAISK